MLVNVKTNWQDFIKQETTKDYWLILNKQIANDYQQFTVLPKQDEIFRCFNFFNYNQTKVVLLGQDPYPNSKDACGLAFSVNRSINLPVSERNLFVELKNDLQINRANGDLSDWAQQGVLLLNTSLTFCKESSHINLWKQFIINCLKFIDIHCSCVFILLGQKAQVYRELIVNNKHNIILAGHPSFANLHKSFFGAKIFSKTNAILEKMSIIKINW
ncbi:MAG: uracil-DNA glycosylase [Mycoplasmataceae bacterium]|jgi:uracil-DNA glycosylase|nr:uracil-DNA glycosylase [Mycoplasmataceae bacterium]